MNFGTLSSQLYNDNSYSNLSNLNKNTVKTDDTDKNAEAKADTLLNQNAEKTTNSPTVTEETKAVSNSKTEDSSDDAAVQMNKAIESIKGLQSKIKEMTNNSDAPTGEAVEELSKLKKQLESELSSIQLTVRKNVSTLMDSLFSSSSDNKHSGLFFNNKA
ncbi:hypothetical protein B0W48_00640 [Pseudoalteromonas aliena]|uniref:Uncharacterized protein n=1 Tax=Pseudoalteromonas aliena TaxID=247523 RepID=A0A1Q2GTI5_9GAMM|nr:hypothetical protein [Pseudoalteromonas aliena]AQP98429.1 hypothetical protein B0W48_00640 [Pseudoalteromonas aliena]